MFATMVGETTNLDRTLAAQVMSSEPSLSLLWQFHTGVASFRYALQNKLLVN